MIELFIDQRHKLEILEPPYSETQVILLHFDHIKYLTISCDFSNYQHSMML